MQPTSRHRPGSIRYEAGAYRVTVRVFGQRFYLGRFQNEQTAVAALDAGLRKLGLSRTPCTGHQCDGCRICQAGRCCKRDRPDYRLPDEGEWDGPIYGQIGVLAGNGDELECHACGGYYRSLAAHVLLRHDLSVQEYRAIFGLKMSTALWGQTLRQLRGRQTKQRLECGDLVPLTGNEWPRLTAEQRSEIGTRAAARAEHRITTRARWAFCRQGHRLAGANVLPWNGRRICRICRNERARRYRAARRRLGQG
jgi:hypothetical protein